jgi:choline dehydrogenase-like flavoprotein
MFADGRTVPQDEVVRTDICVVGGGPSGITLSRELEAAGFEVLLVERGETDRMGPPVDPDTAVNVGVPYGVAESRVFEFGGAVHKWRASTPLGRGFGRLRELDHEDFEARLWIPHSGWPFDKEHLRPFYERARSLFDCAWPSGAPEDSWDTELNHTPFCDGDGRIRTRVFSFANPAVFPAELKRELARSEKALVLTNAVAVDIQCEDSPSAVSAIKIVTAPVHAFTVRARAYVLAAGGIENPRLLLASRSRQTNGLGNGHDLVGRFFMEHPHYASGRLVPRQPAIFSDRANYEIHLHHGLPIQKKYSLSEDVVRVEQLSRCTFRFEAKPVTESVHTLRYSESAIRSLETAARLRRALVRRQWAPATSRYLAGTLRGAHHIARHGAYRALLRAGQALKLPRYTLPQMFWIRAMAEQVPNPDSRVRLGDTRDPFGVPIGTLDWQLTEQDLSSMQRSQELFGQALLQAGHRKVESLVDEGALPPALAGGNHHMGTTRMHDSPRRGVVNKDCRVHGLNNLYVAGSSVFPTVGYANPTLTLLALTLRLGDHLKVELT